MKETSRGERQGGQRMEAMRKSAFFAVYWGGVLAVFVGTGWAGERMRFEVETPSRLNPQVVFEAYVPAGQENGIGRPLLFLVPGYNGNGGAFLIPDAGWLAWADREKVVLLTATFWTNPEEIQARRGYYYPEEWSGEAVFAAVKEVAARTPVRGDSLLLFGFSAGAHFVHRFARWAPGRVGAFVAYSAGWWDEPNARMKTVPALIMCGEDDPRLNASLAFAQAGLVLGCPWIWRSYPQTGHAITPEVNEMARVFLAHYAQEPEVRKKAVSLVGDAQTFHLCSRLEAEGLPAICRIMLPSREIADVWKEK